MDIDRDEIKRLRKAEGLTITEVAMLSGLSRAYVSQLESGNSTNPSISSIKSIAQALQCRIEDIFPAFDRFNAMQKETINNVIIRQTPGLSDRLKYLTERNNADLETGSHGSMNMKDMFLCAWLQEAEIESARAVLVMAIRCGYRGEDALAKWLSFDATESDSHDVHVVARQCGFSPDDTP